MPKLLGNQSRQAGYERGMSYIRQVTQEKGLSMRALSILNLRSAIGLTIFSVLIFGSLIAKADVIAERKANFKANAAAMKALSLIHI